MATGDITVFDATAGYLGTEQFNFSSDTIKLGIITNVAAPTAADATPTWSDYVANEVGTGGGYTANGLTLASVTWTAITGGNKLDATDVSLSQNAAGFTDGYWGVLYDDTATTDQAFAFIELGGPVSEVAGPITITWGANGIMTVAKP